MEIDQDGFFDAVWEIIEEEAKTVLKLGWDGDSPGNSGVISLIVWKELYCFSALEQSYAL